MFFFLSKILHFLLSPLSWVVILLLFGAIFKRHRQRSFWSSLFVIVVFGNSFLVHEVSLLWETPFQTDEVAEQSQTAVVLGGYAYYSPVHDRVIFRESTDRLMQGLRLLKTGKVNRLVLSGGSGFLLKQEYKEGDYVSEFLDQLGIRKRRILVENESRNTHENALNTKKLLISEGLSDKPIVLITSALHMPRSKACFEHEGLNVIPYPTNLNTGSREYGLDHMLVPNVDAMRAWNALLHEWFGYLAYAIAGYV